MIDTTEKYSNSINSTQGVSKSALNISKAITSKAIPKDKTKASNTEYAGDDILLEYTINAGSTYPKKDMGNDEKYTSPL